MFFKGLKAAVDFLPEALFKHFHTVNIQDMISRVILVDGVLADESELRDELEGRQIFWTMSGRRRQFGETLEAHFVVESSKKSI